LAPVTRLKGNSDSSLETISKNYKTINSLLDGLGLYEIFGATWSKYENSFCSVMGPICAIFSSMSGMVSS
jgi:hypothetical protein